MSSIKFDPSVESSLLALVGSAGVSEGVKGPGYESLRQKLRGLGVPENKLESTISTLVQKYNAAQQIRAQAKNFAVNQGTSQFVQGKTVGGAQSLTEAGLTKQQD